MEEIFSKIMLFYTRGDVVASMFSKSWLLKRFIEAIDKGKKVLERLRKFIVKDIVYKKTAF